MENNLREVSEEELQGLILKETVFPTKTSAIKEKILSQGIAVRLTGLAILDLGNRKLLTEFPGYYYQAAEPYEHQMSLPDFEAENRHEVATRELVEFFRSIPDPRPCH